MEGDDGYEMSDTSGGTDSSGGSDSSGTADSSTGEAGYETSEDNVELTETSELYDASDLSGDGAETELYEVKDNPGTEELMDGATVTPSDSWEDIDFSTTMSTPYEQDVLNDMDEKGEIDIPEVDPSLEEPEFGTPHLPTENSGFFEGERGNSAFVPDSPNAQAALSEYGKDAVEYVDGEPDFSPFTVHDTPFGQLDCEVQIGHMTTDRQNPSWEYGDRRPSGSSHDVNYDLGNFAQGDNALVDKAIEQNPGFVEGKTPEEVASLRADMAREIEGWRTSNGLTWHECRDGATMQLVPTPIHDACRHSGGVSTMRTVQEYGDVRRAD